MKTIKNLIALTVILGLSLSCNFVTEIFSSDETVPEPAPAEQEAETVPAPLDTSEPATATAIPPSPTPEPPTATPEPAAIPADQDSITIVDLSFRIVAVGYDDTALGMAPAGMGSSEQVVWVEFELLSGDQAAFESLELTLSDGQGRTSQAVILVSGGMMQMLSTVTMTGEQAIFVPGEDNIAWAFVFPEDAAELYLEFPSGEVIDLTPRMP
ncbi:MAG: hypothetical protein JW862_05995 [Anaerolineales bacterium]|nr:hypothetical protein [Anaerolineales bacterium]